MVSRSTETIFAEQKQHRHPENDVVGDSLASKGEGRKWEEGTPADDWDHVAMQASSEHRFFR